MSSSLGKTLKSASLRRT